MANYKEQTTTGQSWQRCYRVVIDNPLNETPVITFHEEQVINVGDNVIKQPITACRLIYSADTQFNVLNPQTGEPTGATLTHQQLYTYLYSLYMATALQRDAEANTPNKII